MYEKQLLIYKNMKLVKIASLILIIGLVGCQKENFGPYSEPDATLNKEVMKPSLHNTSTSLSIPVNEDEVVFSFILSSNQGTKDAVVYYSVDSQIYDQSLYLTHNVNIADHGFDQGLFTYGVKAVMKSFSTREPENRKYYFKIVRLAEEEKFTYFGIEILPCGNIVLTDDCLKSNLAKPVITYYIKTGEDEVVDYINVRIE
jgi:hypothetical protein